MPVLVSLDLSGAIIQLAPGVPVTTGTGANTTIYSWSTLWGMADEQLTPLNIYRVADPVQNPANNQFVCGIVYDKNQNGTIVATALYQTKPTPPAPTFTQLKTSLTTAGILYCNHITTQIIPNPIYQNAFVLAASIIGPTGVIPSSDPLKTEFDGLAASFGLTSTQFAGTVLSVTATSFALSAALATLNGAVYAATDVSTLTPALDTFTNTVNSLVSVLNASGLTVTIVQPPAISIVGINA